MMLRRVNREFIVSAFLLKARARARKMESPWSCVIANSELFGQLCATDSLSRSKLARSDAQEDFVADLLS